MSLDPIVSRRLGELLDADRVIAGGPALAGYARDALRPFRGHHPAELLVSHPDAAVLPRTIEEVAAIVRLAAGHGVPIVPYGGGTGLMGGARSPRGGIVVDLKGLDAIVGIAPIDRTVTAQAGVVLADLDAALNAHGLMLGHDPWTLPIATVGGAISTDGVGYLAGRYGSMGDQVLGLTVVLADGRVLRTRAVPRRATGINLDRLFIGAEGLFGLIVEATLRAFPRPERERFVGYRFPDFAAGFAVVGELAAIGLRPAMLDLGEEPPATAATLLLGFQGFAEEVEALAGRADRICRAAGAAPLVARDADAFWAARHQVAERYRDAVRNLTAEPAPVSEGEAFDFVHVALPPSQVLTYRQQAWAIVDRAGVQVGEAGIWVCPALYSLALFHPGAGREPATTIMARVVDELLLLAQQLGGSMEYVHGVGTRLAHLMRPEHGIGLDLMLAVKRTLDPFGILNPGKTAL